jgi:BirA family biotin operon repressor/biotin-[acetyl-CoA-carboxylase] ligase
VSTGDREGADPSGSAHEPGPRPGTGREPGRSRLPASGRIPQLEAAVLSASPLVRRWIWQPRIDSTQRLARELARAEAPGLVVLADVQSAGQGREGRIWFSPRRAGLWLSIIVGSARPESEWPMLTSLAALAVRQALAGATGLPAGIKWPNDVFCRGRKIAGILADVVAGSGGGRGIVLGLGLNIAQQESDFPPELYGRATSVRIETGRVWDRAPLLEALLGALDCGLRRFEAGGAAAIRPELRAAALLLGRRVRVRAARGEEVAGLVLDIGEVGELVLETAAAGRPAPERPASERLAPGRPAPEQPASERTTVAGGTILAIDPPLDQEV